MQSPKVLLAALFPWMRWPRLTHRLAKSEALAGLTVAWIIIPQCIAYALLAGMPPVTGFFMGLIPAIVAVCWGSSATLATGPAALTCVLVGASIAGMDPSAAPQSGQWVQWGVWLALLSGALQWALGALRLGWFISLVSNPVMMGFTQAAACLIIASQLPAWFGVGSLTALYQGEARINLWALIAGGSTLAALLLSKRWTQRVPWMLLVIMASAATSAALNYSAHGAVIGALPLALPSTVHLSLPSVSQLEALVLPAVVIALVSFLEAASSAKVEHQRFGTRWNDNQDLIGQGMAKVAAGLLGAAPSSASFSRSALNLYSGARTPWATVFMVVFAAGLLLVGQHLLAVVPKAVLAGVVIAAVHSLIKPSAIVQVWRSAKPEAVIAGLTFVATLLSAPSLYWGVLLGVVLCLGHFLYQRLHPRMIEVGLHADGSIRDRILWTLPPLGRGVYALRMDAALDFASAASFERRLFDAIALRQAAGQPVQHVCVFAQPINWIDQTGMDTLCSIHAALASMHIELHISGLKLPLEQAFERAGVLQASATLHRYRSEAETVAVLKCL